MIIKTCELEGDALGWAAEVATGCRPDIAISWVKGGCHPSSDWARGGPLIGEYLIELMTNTGSSHGAHERWYAVCPTGTGSRGAMGPTALVAAMRALVMAMLGDEVDVPHEIAKSGGRDE